MSAHILAKTLLLPELKLLNIEWDGPGRRGIYYCQKEATIEYCPKCATPSQSIYDHRLIKIKDTPIRYKGVQLAILKRRLWCKPCKKPFTEYVNGIQKGHRTTDRFEAELLQACNRYSNLSQVRKDYGCSSDFLYKALYKELSRECKEKLNYEWPKELGIDEHAFKRNPKTGYTEYVSMIVDHSNERVRELVEGKRCEDLTNALSAIEGRQNVKWVTIDMCDGFKKFIKEFFPQAEIVADKFHVLRLLSPVLLKKRKEITGTKADGKAKKLLLMSSRKLDRKSAVALWGFLNRYPQLRELYEAKEMLHDFYHTKTHKKAAKNFTLMTDRLAESQLPEVKKLRKTLLKWRHEVLNYFKNRLTNARTEGFNNKAKVVKRRGYGYKSFKNYRLRVLQACC
jgi:transposase